MVESTPFGKAMRETHFNFTPGYVPLNHGSFGTYPNSVKDRLHKCQAAAEGRPDTFLRYQVPLELDVSRKAMASFLNVPASEIVFIPNATTGVNTVLRSLRFVPGDLIVYFSTIYGGCEKTVQYLIESTSVEGEKLELQYPIADDDILRIFEEQLQREKSKSKTVKVAIFDTISSFPGVRMPWERLVRLCRENKVLSLVDGAHGIGHCSLSHLGEIEPDFLVTNCHKWLFVPRGCCLLYVPSRNQHLIRSSLPTSHGFKPLLKPGQPEIFNPLPSANTSDFVNMFQFTATIDPSPYLCIEEALRFRSEVCGGEEKIIKYCTNLAQEGGQRIAERLGTEIMRNEGTCFVNIRLPLKVGESYGEVKKSDIFRVIDWFANALVRDYDTFVVLYFHACSFWVRISGQIYLELDDVVWCAGVLKELCERVSKGEYLETKPAL